MRILLPAVAAVLFASSALAGDDDDAQAKALFHEGETDYQAGKYDEALAAFMAAYDTSHVAGLLFNIGQCHRALQHHERAVDFYERYLKAVPDAPNKKDIAALIQGERALIAPASGATTTAPTTPALGATPASANPLARTTSSEEKPGAPPFWQEPVFWGVAGGAAAAVLVGSTVAVVLATQPPPPRPSGSLGTFDLRSP